MTNQTQRPDQPPLMQRRIPTHGPDRPRIVDPAYAGQMATPRRGNRKRRKSNISTAELVIWIGFGGAALAVLAVIAFFSLFVLFTLSDRILPGVLVGDSEIGGMSVEKASETLWADWNENKQLVVSDGMNYWWDSPAQFGLYLDSTSTAESAYEIGRGTEGLSQFFGLIRRGKQYVAPEVVVNMEIARAKLELYAEIIDVPATDAALQYTSGEWTAQPGITGVALDVPHTLADLVNQRTLVMSSGYFSFTLMPVAPQFEDVSAALESLQPVLNRPMRFEAYDPISDETTTWEVAPETFASWVRIENLGGDPSLTVDEAALAAYLQEWQVQLGNGRTLQEDFEIGDLVAAWKADQRYAFIVWYPASSYEVQPGDMLTEIAYRARMPYWKILEANPGIDPENLISGEMLVIPSKNEMLPEPIVKSKRIVISITSQRMWTYENGNLLKEYVISTGVDDSPTLPGIYQVQTHELEAYASVWDLYMPHFIGIYQGWPGFWNGIHGLPTLSSGVQLWGSVLGRKASFGCIIMDLDSAETVYHWADTGVVVEIQP